MKQTTYCPQLLICCDEGYMHVRLLALPICAAACVCNLPVGHKSTSSHRNEIMSWPAGSKGWCGSCTFCCTSSLPRRRVLVNRIAIWATIS
eukprot:6462329-Amphidinium_carterae.4